MLLISVTLAVLRFSIPIMLFRFSNPLNHKVVLVKVVQFANEASKTTEVILSLALLHD